MSTARAKSAQKVRKHKDWEWIVHYQRKGFSNQVNELLAAIGRDTGLSDGFLRILLREDV